MSPFPVISPILSPRADTFTLLQTTLGAAKQHILFTPRRSSRFNHTDEIQTPSPFDRQRNRRDSFVSPPREIPFRARRRSMVHEGRKRRRNGGRSNHFRERGRGRGNNRGGGEVRAVSRIKYFSRLIELSSKSRSPCRRCRTDRLLRFQASRAVIRPR